jgi:SPP1 gp7 family putative phage head morphogenesis protein
VADANQLLFDALVRHQIGLLQVSGSIRNAIFEILNGTEEQIREKILGRLDGVTGGATPENLKRAQLLAQAITKIRATAWAEVTDKLIQDMIDVAKAEPTFTDTAIKSVAPVVLDTVLPSAAQLRALVLSQPFEGRILSAWAKDIQAADLKRISDAIHKGVVQGYDARTIAQSVVGTARTKGADGITQITRNNAEAIVRTAINHISNSARAEYVSQNTDIVANEQFVATLDARTTPVCQSNDGKVFPVGEGPIPPLHFGCRSTRVPVLDGVVLAQRPARPFTERQLAQEYSDQAGLADTANSRGTLPHGHKGPFDEFAATRIRELTGTVPESVSYQDWLGRQTAAFQDDVLGPTRGLLFRSGDLTLDKFVNRTGDELTLHELAAREAEAFRKAGLNPEDF